MPGAVVIFAEAGLVPTVTGLEKPGSEDDCHAYVLPKPPEAPAALSVIDVPAQIPVASPVAAPTLAVVQPGGVISLTPISGVVTLLVTQSISFVTGTGVPRLFSATLLATIRRRSVVEVNTGCTDTEAPSFVVAAWKLAKVTAATGADILPVPPIAYSAPVVV